MDAYRQPANAFERVATAAPGCEDFAVEAIRGTRVNRRGQREYLVKWQGYGEHDNSWEEETDMVKDGLDDVIDAFKKRQALPPPDSTPPPSPPGSTLRGDLPAAAGSDADAVDGGQWSLPRAEASGAGGGGGATSADLHRDLYRRDSTFAHEGVGDSDEGGSESGAESGSSGKAGLGSGRSAREAAWAAGLHRRHAGAAGAGVGQGAGGRGAGAQVCEPWEISDEASDDWVGAASAGAGIIPAPTFCTWLFIAGTVHTPHPTSTAPPRHLSSLLQLPRPSCPPAPPPRAPRALPPSSA